MVVSTGAMVDGFETAIVRTNLEQKLRLSPLQAQAFFEKPRVLKKGLLKTDAEKLSGQLAKLGIETTFEKIEPRLNKPKVGLSLEPRDDDEQSPTEQAEPTTDQPMRCPHCDQEQPRSEQCASCGVWFHKLPQPPVATPEAAESIGTSLTGTGSGAAAGLSAGAAAEADDDPVEHEHLSAKSIATAVGAVLLGAIDW